MAQHLKDYFEDMARKGDGSFAIAYALIDLADSQEATAKALKKLGLADASTPFGALEALGMSIEKTATTLGEHIEIAASSIASALPDKD